MRQPPEPRIAIPPLSAAAFAVHDPRTEIADLGGATMGTTWSVRLAPAPGLDLPSLRRTIQSRLDGLVWQMSHWRTDSLLTGYNRAPAGTWAVLPPDFAAVMKAGLEIAAASEGAFDPTLGTLVDLWGYGPNLPLPATEGERARDAQDREEGEGRPPSPNQIAQALATSGHRRTRYHPTARRLLQPGGLHLDLSGIAKGYAVDALAALVAAHGIGHALVEIGGELAGRGIRPDGEPWWVELENPVPEVLAPFRVALHGLAVATSGDYVRGAHTIDGRTGRPAAHGVISASVLHPSTMHADAWASALTVLGPDEGMALAAREGLAARLIVRDGGYREMLSPALEAML